MFSIHYLLRNQLFGLWFNEPKEVRVKLVKILRITRIRSDLCNSYKGRIL